MRSTSSLILWTLIANAAAYMLLGVVAQDAAAAYTSLLCSFTGALLIVCRPLPDGPGETR